MPLFAQMFDGMQFFPLILAVMIAGVAVSLAAMFAALLRRIEIARIFGVASMVGALLAVGFFAWLLGDELTLQAYLVLASPMVLGSFALFLARLFQGERPMTRGRFIVRIALLLQLVAIAVLGIVQFVHVSRFREWDRYVENFQRMPLPAEVELEADAADEQYKVSGIKITVPGRDDTLIVLAPSERLKSCKADDVHQRLTIRQIGPWQFRGDGRLYGDAETLASSTSFEMNGIELGSEGGFVRRVPYQVHSIQDVIEQYDELVEFFRTWPTEDQPGRFEVRDGATLKVLHYHRTADPEFPTAAHATAE